MKTLQLHFGKALIYALMISSISCSTDDVVTSEDENASLELRDEITDAAIIAEATAKLSEITDDQLALLEKHDQNRSSARSVIRSARVQRYYDPSKTVHSYYSPDARRGSRFGRYEGIAFNTIMSINNTSLNPSQHLRILLLRSPNNNDFVITTSQAEFTALFNQGWGSSVDNSAALQNTLGIYRTGGNGRVRLYRFYKASISDHLFTKNYSEGINNGYTFEGVTGWVK